MKTRAISALFYVLIIILGTSDLGSVLLLKYFDIHLAQKYIFALIMLLFYFIVMLEVCFMMNYDNKLFIGITVLLGFYPIYLFIKPFMQGYSYFNQVFNFTLYLKSALFVLMTFLAIITIFKNEFEIRFDTSKLIFNVIYIGIPFALVYAIPSQYPYFGSEIFYIFVLIWISDTAAYFVGTKYGKTKIFPNISPKKSREGLIAGIIATLITGICIELFKKELQGNYIIIGIIVSIIAPLGDLMASKIKRIFKVKDSSNLIPGHGGFLDRLDSFILCIPFVFIYLILAK